MDQIPVHLTGFIGREWELAEVQRLLAQTRLLTLTGSGGCGKSRLATAVTTRVLDGFTDGLWWVDLAGLSEPTLVPQAVAQVLDLREAPNQPLTTILITYFHSRQALLVLDNCEHLVGACAQLADTLLRATPKLNILTTSREALGIASEVTWLVPSLSLPPLGSESYDLEESEPSLLQYDAIRLFVERATAVLPTFTITRKNQTAVIQICQRLDGIPLAIELAAARVRLLEVEQIVARLDDRFRLLTLGSRTVILRHQTLRATIEWSHDLLSEPERILFRRLAVFAGGFTLEAAETICAGQALDTGDVLDLLTQLTNKSLVVVERVVGQAARFRTLETIRQYALVKLREAGETEPVNRRHLDYFLALAETAEPKLVGPEEMVWLDRLEAEHDNLRAALSWSGTGQMADVEVGLRLIGALAEFWLTRGHLAQGRHWVEKALPQASLVSLPVQARLLWTAGLMLRHQGEIDQAVTLFQESLSLYQKLGDSRGAAWVLCELGHCVGYYRDDVAQALSLLEQSLALAREVDDRVLISAVYKQLGLLALHQGAYSQAVSLNEKALSLAQEVGSQKVVADRLYFLGFALNLQGEYERAFLLLREGLALAEQIQDRPTAGLLLSALGESPRVRGAYEEAKGYYQACLKLAREMGDKELAASALHNLGHVALRQGQLEDARALFIEGLSLSRELAYKEFIGSYLAGLAGVAAAEGQPARAARLFGASEALLQSINLQLQAPDKIEQEHNVAIARAQLDEATFSAAWAQGRAMSLEEAIAYAQEKDEGRGAKEEGADVREGVQPSTQPSATPINIVSAVPELRLLALGPAQVYRREHLLVAADWTFAKPKELLFYLVCHPPRTKEQIGLVLWPDASAEQLRNSFRATLYQLRRTLGRPEWILFEDGRYSFNRTLDYWFDVETFTTHLAKAKSLQEPEMAISHLQPAAKLYKGDFLEDLAADEWGWAQREELLEQYVVALRTLGALLFAIERYGEAADVYRQVILRDNLLEAAHRELIRCYARLGERGQALRHYQALINLLGDELGAPPEPETEALFKRLRKGESV